MATDGTAPLPLAGIRVLDLSRLLPGGFCSMLLADHGADVLKVEDTAAGDYIRWAPPRIDGVEPSSASALFLALNRGKRSIRLDLKVREGCDVLLRLVRDADVLLESFRPGVLDRLGVGYERLREENPGLVYCAITGYGQEGPDRGRAGHDIDYLARAGLLGLSGAGDGAPALAAAQIADVGGGAQMAAFAILAALRERDRSGEGQFVDVVDDARRAELARPARRPPSSRTAPSRGAASSSSPAGCRATASTRAPTAGSRSARSSRSSGWRCATGSAATTCASASSTPPWPVSWRRRSPRGRARSGRRSTTRTAAASSRCWTSTRRSSARPTPSSRWSSPAPPRRSACSARRSRSRARPPTARGRVPALGADTDDVLARRRLRRRRDRRAQGRGRGRRARRHGARELPGVTDRPGLKMSELGRAPPASPPARSSTTCARACSATAGSSARRATWPGTRRTTSTGSARSSGCRRSASCRCG